MTARRLRSRAFGLEIDSSFEAPGLPPVAGPAVGPPTRLELAPEREIDDAWPAGGSERILEERFDGDGAPSARTIDVHPEHGYRLYARGFGLARIAADGSLVECAPPASEAAWSWQRFLVGRVLPWAAVLRGYEVLHASAVAVDGRAIAFVGPTGAGKTSLALRLVAGGASFLTDDVVAIDVSDGRPRAHPGAGVAGVRPAERDAIEPAVWERLGTVLGHSEKTYLALDRVDEPLELAAVCFIAGGDGPLVERMPTVDPRLLLTSTFVLGVRTPERMRTQLDVCASLAAHVPALWLRGCAAGPEKLAAAVVDEVRAARAPA
ncbi:MAG TPA: hypothetical protein VJT75_16650 [Thermoleophilaceae bacterium]|nr:hypothetical protein [Thermoleophilaceae bacterium]